MLTIRIPDDNVKERQYIIHVLMSEFLGLNYRLESGQRDCTEIILESGNTLLVEDHFFRKYPKPLDYLNQAHIPETVAWMTTDLVDSSTQYVVIYGRAALEQPAADNVICGLDVFASSFFMLSRWEEAVVTKQDRHGRFPADYSLAYRAGFLTKPVVNEYCELLYLLLKRLGLTQAKREREFTLTLTHDIDKLRMWDGFYTWARTLIGDVVKRRDLHLFCRNVVSFVAARLFRRRDPYDVFDYLLAESKKRSLRATYYFMSGGQSRFDGFYRVHWREARAIVEKIAAQGHIIGLHPSYDSFDDPQAWGQEKAAIETVTGEPLLHARQHYLRFAVPQTWQICEDFGIVSDSSIYYAEAGGFRAGVCYQYSVFNVRSRQVLKLQENPILIMDGTILAHGRSVTDIVAHIQATRDIVRRYAGEFTVLWHNSSFYLPQYSEQDLRTIYAELIRE